jgi:AcrR family transcriptional regulator
LSSVPADPPLTLKAQDTRHKLLRTARQLFERDGYDATSVSRIVEAAEVSRGTFYLYFDSKRDIFGALMDEISAGMVALQTSSWEGGGGPHGMIRHAIETYVVFYRDNARMMAVLEQLAAYDADCRALRLEMRRTVALRAERFITTLQRRGAIPGTVDPRYAALALTGMVDRFAYVWLILGEELDERQVVENLSRLWYQAVGGEVGADEPGTGCAGNGAH